MKKKVNPPNLTYFEENFGGLGMKFFNYIFPPCFPYFLSSLLNQAIGVEEILKVSLPLTSFKSNKSGNLHQDSISVPKIPNIYNRIFLKINSYQV